MNHIMKWLEQGDTLVTASHRLASRLRYQYTQYQLGLGKSVWESPDILHWQVWLQRGWEEYSQNHPQVVLLNAEQEQVLWQQIINSSSYADKLLHQASIAKRVSKAWELLNEYLIPIFPDNIYVGEDAFAFKSWADAFQQECDAKSWLDNARLPKVLTEYYRDRNPCSEQLMLMGFEDFTPQQQGLLDAIEAVGTKIRNIPSPQRNQSVFVNGYADTNAELKAAANWVRTQLQNNPESSIGVVVPNLHAMRNQIAAVFENCLSPATLVNDSISAEVPFSLSLGKPLSDYALIDTAFSLLGLCHENFPIHSISSILHSPFIKGADNEIHKRAILDAALYKHGETRLTLKSVFYVASKLNEEARPVQFLQGLKQAREYKQQLTAKQSHSDWAKHLTTLLQLLGWYGERSLDSTEYQLLQEWKKVLSRFVSLQMIMTPSSYASVLTQLKRIAGETNFQPESEETPVQILGMAGAADMAFDHLWIMGLHDEVWPPAAQPNPFIPIALQRQYKLPHATAEIALSYSQDVLNGLLQSATNVVVSYPQNEAERVLRKSPLLNNINKNEQAFKAQTSIDFPELVYENRQLEEFVDTQAPVVPTGETVSGGTALFKDQSACPFRAFARHRLHATTLDDVDIGLNARDRGLILHRVLQLFWQRLGSLEKLQFLSGDERQALVETVVNETINSNKQQYSLTYTERFTQLEKSRLKNILNEWLDVELQRAAFEVVACEQAMQINFAGIEIRGRVDRIDQLKNGKQVIIDYKTGLANVYEWAGERPDDPQLPLYAVNHHTEVAALAFARLQRGDKFGYQGLAEENDLIPDIKAFTESRFVKGMERADEQIPAWEDLFKQWHDVLLNLADDFRQGHAEVNPKRAQTCLYCDQQVLCRIYEKGMQDNEEIEE